ncbi:MAG: argininosuccinate lyase [Bacteroidota bacterium]|nr:argininosuccinate lyase [Bacteroidota bacterium]MDP4230981.1 argininosuccinate lyase [Bacteroidota bacterium]
MNEDQRKAPLWGGRFRKQLDPAAKVFSSSIKYDKRFAKEDIEGSIAHVTMLGECNIIPAGESTLIVSALKQIREEITAGTLQIPDDSEDVHLAIEELLIQRIGSVGGKLHTARSRNDQIALDQRLFLRKELRELQNSIKELQRDLIAKAQANRQIIIPGYTHMQRAQPVLLAHHLLAYVSMLGRDAERIADCLVRINLSPLGAAAFAGTSFPIDRDAVASQLGFSGVVFNSIDAVSDRDYVIEVAGVCSIIMMHLSRFAEELILWSTSEFGFVEMDDCISTGSSIMPQKKNPDIAELIRGRSGRVYGALMNLLTIMKGLPLAYNRDMQCDREPMFEALETTSNALAMMKLIVANITFRSDHLKTVLQEGFLTATEIADYLVRKGETFREAHRITGELTGYCAENNLSFTSLDLEKLRSYSPKFSEDVFDILDPERSIALKVSLGSSSQESVDTQLIYWKNKLSE